MLFHTVDKEKVRKGSVIAVRDMASDTSSWMNDMFSSVNKLESRIDCLLQSISESFQLIERILDISDRISNAEMQMDSINESITENYTFLSKVKELQEKSFLLQSGLETTDMIINKSTLDNICKEYKCLKKRMSKNNEYIIDDEEKSEKLRTQSQSVVPKSPLQKKISISNLRLKPIRCQSGKIRKMKSKYRISRIYNLIPVSSKCDEESECFPLDTQGTINSTTSQNQVTSQVLNEDISFNVSATSAENSTSFSSSSVFSDLRRSKSVPGSPLFRSFHNSPEDLSLGSCNKKGSHELATLKKPLKHTRSFPLENERDGFRYMNPLEMSSILEGQEIDSKQYDDVLSGVADEVSYYSDNSDNMNSSEEFENFEKYLRNSRINLRDAFPNILNQSRSHESALSYSLIAPPVQFHNPIENVKLSKVRVVEPTVESSLQFQEKSNLSAFPERQTTSKELLSNMISKSEKLDGPTEDIDDLKSRLKVFHFALSAPFQSSRNTVFKEENISDQSLSLSESFINLLGVQNRARKIPIHKSFRRSSQESKVNHRSSSSLTSFFGDYSLNKGLQQRQDGAHSQLIIGSNRTATLSHANDSLFKKPIVREFHKNSLEEALSSSIV